MGRTEAVWGWTVDGGGAEGVGGKCGGGGGRAGVCRRQNPCADDDAVRLRGAAVRGGRRSGGRWNRWWREVDERVGWQFGRSSEERRCGIPQRIAGRRSTFSEHIAAMYVRT